MLRLGCQDSDVWVIVTQVDVAPSKCANLTWNPQADEPIEGNDGSHGWIICVFDDTLYGPAVDIVKPLRIGINGHGQPIKRIGLKHPFFDSPLEDLPADSNSTPNCVPIQLGTRCRVLATGPTFRITNIPVLEQPFAKILRLLLGY
ncbi:MAG: hypothetical protein AAF483_01900 [Planctomycetota bacterium]